MFLGNIPTRLVVLLGMVVASLIAIALAQPSWSSGAWALCHQFVVALIAGAIVFGGLLAVVLLVIEIFSPGQHVLSWQEMTWHAAGLLFGVLLVALAPSLSSIVPPGGFSVTAHVASFVGDLGRLLGAGLVVYNSYRMARDLIRRTGGN